jgi:hypothetical protein
MSGSDQKTSAEKKAERSNVIEEQIKEAQRRKEERSFLEELAKRITIAREGRQMSEKHDFSGAITAYRRFLSITARSMKVEVEELRPQLIEEKSRNGESLLISSILFDMLKILDKLDSATAKEERKLCHQLFIRFTVGQNFQMFAAENLRKFIVYRKSIRHKSEFWATYQAIKVKKFCAVATWAFASENAPEVRALRKFRDERLSRSAAGRGFVRWYYRNGASVVRVLDRLPGAKSLTRTGVRLFTKNLMN